jgi:hypothetical protein
MGAGSDEAASAELLASDLFITGCSATGSADVVVATAAAAEADSSGLLFSLGVASGCELELVSFSFCCSCSCFSFSWRRVVACLVISFFFLAGLVGLVNSKQKHSSLSTLRHLLNFEV